jgi:VWFA-related protein
MPLSAATRNIHPLILSAARRVLSHQRAALLYFLIIAITISAPSSTAAQTPEGDSDTVRINTDLLLFPVRLKDKRGQAVSGLNEHDLLLTDRDHVSTGLYFAPGGDRVALVFALDQSGSLREIISQQRDAALALFGRFSRRSRIAVLRFAQQASLVVPFAQEADSAREAFTFSAGNNQRTAIFDGAAAAVKSFDMLPPDRAERRLVILISDGLDNASNLKAREVIDLAHSKQVSFYVIHLPLFEPRDGRLVVREPAKGFRELAEKTGGKYFLVGAKDPLAQPRQNDLTPIFNAIEEDLRSQYLLGFYIADHARDGRQHSFAVGLTRPNLEFSILGLGFSHKHTFLVNLPADAKKLPQ